ncbi:MAG: hypothetical protein ACRDDH_14515 [Cetobacterium sp.]|uniref:hypothetical protein n=1 Tax=Cetobacterium sp. TaxID=2071632 RepID=UPI003EE5C984
MELREVLAPFSGVGKREVATTFKTEKGEISVKIGINPNNKDVLASIYLDREPVIINRVVLVGESIINCIDSVKDWGLVFLYKSTTIPDGNLLRVEEIGETVHLYYFEQEEME